MQGLAEFEMQGLHLQFAPSAQLWTWLLPLVCALLSASLLTSVLIKLAPAQGWVVLPRQERWGRRTVAQFGGIPILLAFTIGALFLFRGQQSLVLLLLTWGAGLLGLADDITRLAPKAKLAGQILLAVCAVYAGYVHPLTNVYWLNVLFTIFWIVGITNAMNLLDNMDGLAAGIAVIALTQIMLFAGQDAPIRGLALCMLASLVAFLFFNMHPAKVFMGDCGALAIGFFLACASVKTATHLSGLGSALFIPCLILFIPVFDTLLVSVTRKMNGKPISRGACDHTSHRLVLIGMGDRKAVALLYAIAIAAGASALLWKSAWADLGAGMVSLFLVGAILFWLYLARLRLPENWLSQAEVAPLAVPESVQQFLAAASVILLDATLIALGLYFAYVIRFGNLDEGTRHNFLLASALAIVVKLPVLMACGTYRIRWSIRRRTDGAPVLKGSILASLFWIAVSLVLPKSKTVPIPVLLLDVIFTSSLLLLCRASTGIFEKVIGPASLPVTEQNLAPPVEIGHSGPRHAAAIDPDPGTPLKLAQNTTPLAAAEEERTLS